MEEELVPINDRVLVRVDEPVQPQTMGLARPAGQLEKPTTGVILAFASGLDDFYMSAGRRIHWAKYSGKTITVNGEELLLLRLEEVNGYFKTKEASNA